MAKTRAAVLLGVIWAVAFVAPGDVWRVDKDNVSGTEDGTSWATAFTTIQAAADHADSDGGGEVWVAEGTYAGTTANPIFIMKQGVHLYGGFIGLGEGGLEGSRDARDWNAHQTVIYSERDLPCVRGANDATLDGFTITNNYDDPDDYFSGVGIENTGCSPTVANCTFSTPHGDSMVNKSGSSPRVTHCTLGKMSNRNSSPIVTNCKCGEMNNSSGSSPTATNCRLGGMVNYDSTPTVMNCTFSSGLYNRSGSLPTVTNCILWRVQGVDDDETSGALVTYSDVKGGYPGEGNLDADPLFQNVARDEFRLQAGSPCIDAGTAVGAPNTDYIGVARPQGAGHDMGAYEFRDVDRDGMDDTWETEQGLNPGDPADGVLDLDGDGLTNLQEYGIGTDFRDGADPRRDMYLGPGGSSSDATGDGSEARPWGTIFHAMLASPPHATRISPVTIHLAPGVYSYGYGFVAHVFIAGAGSDLTVLQSEVHAAENTGIRDCTISFGDRRSGGTLVKMDGVAMTLENVVLDGRDNPGSLGILASGKGSSGAVVRNCVIRALENGIHAVDSGIALTRNRFEGIDGDAISIMLPGKSAKADNLTPRLGDGSDGQTGFNRFRFIEGFNVMNWGEAPVKAELNDWGVYTESQIAGKMSPSVDFVPFLGAGTEPASLSGRILNASTGEPIPATANPVVQAGEAVTRPDEEGYYSFASLFPADTTVTVTADGFWTATIDRTLAQGEDAVENFSLAQHTYAPTDFDQSDQTDAIDVELAINGALAIDTGYDCDVNGDGDVDALDVQLVLNAVLGIE